MALEEIKRSLSSEINFETVEAYVNNKFHKRMAASPELISALTRELIQFGYNTIDELDRKLQEAFAILPEEQRGGHLNRAGIIRSSLQDVDPKYRQYMLEDR